MKTDSNLNPTGLCAIGKKVQRFYDLGSPYYLKIFGEHIHDGYYISGKESRPEAQENLIRFLAEKAAIKRGSRILDVGCGLGGSSIWLAKNLEALTVGITISAVQLNLAKKLAREQNATSAFLLMNAEEMEFPERFDFIWLVAALTHFRDQRRFLKLAAQFLKENGKLIIYDWTLDENIQDAAKDRDIRPVKEGMVLSDIYSFNTYLKWLAEDGYGPIYAEDISKRTIKTWDVNLSLLKELSVWKLVGSIRRDDAREIFTFLKGRRAIKRAMQRGKVKSVAVVAQKIG
jgi:tocopherol O-methyltransferase